MERFNLSPRELVRALRGRRILMLIGSTGIALLLALPFARAASGMRDQAEFITYWADESRNVVGGVLWRHVQGDTV